MVDLIYYPLVTPLPSDPYGSTRAAFAESDFAIIQTRISLLGPVADVKIVRRFVSPLLIYINKVEKCLNLIHAYIVYLRFHSTLDNI